MQTVELGFSIDRRLQVGDEVVERRVNLEFCEWDSRRHNPAGAQSHGKRQVNRNLRNPAAAVVARVESRSHRQVTAGSRIDGVHSIFNLGRSRTAAARRVVTAGSQGAAAGSHCGVAGGVEGALPVALDGGNRIGRTINVTTAELSLSGSDIQEFIDRRRSRDPLDHGDREAITRIGSSQNRTTDNLELEIVAAQTRRLRCKTQVVVQPLVRVIAGRGHIGSAAAHEPGLQRRQQDSIRRGRFGRSPFIAELQRFATTVQSQEIDHVSVGVHTRINRDQQTTWRSRLGVIN